MLSDQEQPEKIKIDEVKQPSWNAKIIFNQTNQYDELDEESFSDKSSIDDYTIGKVIGTGAYAVVRVGMNKKTKQKIAVKIYEKMKLIEP